ncbi:putative DNA binding protein [Lysinibacillus phage phiG2]|nr:putative DNA binding protein [Lysinibacillus phage phiG2]
MSRKQNKSFMDKITELESLFGQKETAKRLGVSSATLRNYKTGKTKPPESKAKKVNRVYGQNKKKIKPEQVEKYKQKIETKRRAREEELKKNPKVISTRQWVKGQDFEDFVTKNLLAKASEYIASPTGRVGQFLSPTQLLEKDFGINGKDRKVLIHGLYNTQFYSGGEWVNKNHDKTITQDKTDYIVSTFPITLRRTMDLEQALEYFESKFHKTNNNEGRRRLNPVQFLGFQKF